MTPSKIETEQLLRSKMLELQKETSWVKAVGFSCEQEEQFWERYISRLKREIKILKATLETLS